MDMRVPSPILEQVAEGEFTVTEEDEVEDIVASGVPSGQPLLPGRSPMEEELSPTITRLGRGQTLAEADPSKWDSSASTWRD
jgi:hypothetical protein